MDYLVPSMGVISSGRGMVLKSGKLSTEMVGALTLGPVSQNCLRSEALSDGAKGGRCSHVMDLLARLSAFGRGDKGVTEGHH